MASGIFLWAEHESARIADDDHDTNDNDTNDNDSEGDDR